MFQLRGKAPVPPSRRRAFRCFALSSAEPFEKWTRRALDLGGGGPLGSLGGNGAGSTTSEGRLVGVGASEADNEASQTAGPGAAGARFPEGPREGREIEEEISGADNEATQAAWPSEARPRFAEGPGG